jgi:hypothetical protein
MRLELQYAHSNFLLITLEMLRKLLNLDNKDEYKSL